jgi:hypothetical protein
MDFIFFLFSGHKDSESFRFWETFSQELSEMFSTMENNAYLCTQKHDVMQMETRKDILIRIATELAAVGSKSGDEMTLEQIASQLEIGLSALEPEKADRLLALANQAVLQAVQNHRPEVTEVRPQVLECDVVRFQNNKDKWVALV